MAFLIRSSSSMQPIPAVKQSPVDAFAERVGIGVMTTGRAFIGALPVTGQISAALQARDNWFGTSDPINISISDKLGSRPRDFSCQMKVCGVPIPDGAVLTHEGAQSDLEYRAKPIAETAVYHSTVVMRPAANGYSRPYIETRRTDTTEFRQELQQEAERVTKRLTSQIRSQGADAQQAGAIVSNAMRARLDELDSRLDQEAYGKAVAKLRKVHVGDLQPRRLELRFALLDVESDQAVLSTRFAVLEKLWRMFCQNPTLKASAGVESGKLLTEAARITAAASAGRLVRIKSPGTDCYKVDTWITTSFKHRQVPDNDIIVVQVVLSEFESFFHDGLPEADPAATLPVEDRPVAQTAPSETSTPPTYSITSGWGAFP